MAYDQKTYQIDGTTLTITAMPGTGSGSASVEFEVTQNECNEIKLEILVFTETLKRK